MAYIKISKEEWLKLTKEEQDYLTFEFNKSVEKRRKLTLYLTRGLALIFIGVLFFIGYAQLESVRNYNEKLDKYGTLGFCALCGEYNLKKCECQYNEEYYQKNDYSNLSNELSEYNLQQCSFKKLYEDNPILNITLTK